MNNVGRYIHCPRTAIANRENFLLLSSDRDYLLSWMFCWWGKETRRCFGLCGGGGGFCGGTLTKWIPNQPRSAAQATRSSQTNHPREYQTTRKIISNRLTEPFCKTQLFKHTLLDIASNELQLFLKRPSSYRGMSCEAI